MAGPGGEPGEVEGEAHASWGRRVTGVKTRPRPPAGHAAMAVAVLWLLLPCVLAAASGLIVISLFIVAPLIAAIAADERRTAIVAGATVVLTIAAGCWHGRVQDPDWIRLTAVCAMSLLAVVLAGVRRRREERLARMTAIAQASQLALLPPLPPQITGISIAARYRSGDTRSLGRRGSVRDHPHRARHPGDHRGCPRPRPGRGPAGPARAERVPAKRGRGARAGPGGGRNQPGHQAAPGRGGLRHRGAGPDRARRGAHRGQLRPSPAAAAPRRRAAAADRHDGRLPLGLEDDFTAFTASWRPGDRLLLYTDGLVESRNQHGDFLPEDQIATALLAAGCDQALDTLMTAVHRHTGGHGHDDMALLLLEYGALPHNSANGHPRPGHYQDANLRADFPASEPRKSASSLGTQGVGYQ